MDQNSNHETPTLDRFDVVALILLGVYTLAYGCGWAMGWDWFSSPWLLAAGAFLAGAASQGKSFFQKREKGHLMMAILLLFTAGLGILLAYQALQNKERIRRDQQKEQEWKAIFRTEKIENAVQRIRTASGGFGPYVSCFVCLGSA
jgi:hypothetical protein